MNQPAKTERDPLESKGHKPSAAPWKRRLLLLTISGVVAFSLGEFAARLVFGAPLVERLPVVRIQANPYRGWQMVPGEDHYTYQHLVEINSLGLRSPEIGEREAGEVRVLALGDSLTYGQGVAGDQSIPAVLEAALEASDSQSRSWTVINSGHRGYNTNQELGVLEELGPQLDPDLVILFWYWNDLNLRDIEATYQRLESSGPICQDVNAPMEGRIRWLWYAVQLARRSALIMRLYDVRKTLKSPPYEQLLSNGMRRLRRDLRRLQRLCKEQSVQPMIAIVPEAAGIYGSHPGADMADAAVALMEEHGFQVISLADPVRRLTDESGELPLLPYDGHYNAAANRAMAEYLQPLVLEALGP